MHPQICWTVSQRWNEGQKEQNQTKTTTLAGIFFNMLKEVICPWVAAWSGAAYLLPSCELQLSLPPGSSQSLCRGRKPQGKSIHVQNTQRSCKGHFDQWGIINKQSWGVMSPAAGQGCCMLYTYQSIDIIMHSLYKHTKFKQCWLRLPVLSSRCTSRPQPWPSPWASAPPSPWECSTCPRSTWFCSILSRTCPSASGAWRPWSPRQPCPTSLTPKAPWGQMGRPSRNSAKVWKRKVGMMSEGPKAGVHEGSIVARLRCWRDELCWNLYVSLKSQRLFQKIEILYKILFFKCI